MSIDSVSRKRDGSPFARRSWTRLDRPTCWPIESPSDVAWREIEVLSPRG